MACGAGRGQPHIDHRRVWLAHWSLCNITLLLPSSSSRRAGEIHNVLTVLRLNSQSGGGHNSGSVAQMEVEGTHARGDARLCEAECTGTAECN